MADLPNGNESSESRDMKEIAPRAEVAEIHKALASYRLKRHQVRGPAYSSLVLMYHEESH